MNNFSRIDILASFDILEMQTTCCSCIQGVDLRGVKVCVFIMKVFLKIFYRKGYVNRKPQWCVQES